MSTLSVATLNTANGTTDQTTKTGNASAGAFVIKADGSFVSIQSNGTITAMKVYSNTDIAFSNATVNTFSVSSAGVVTVPGSLNATGAVNAASLVATTNTLTLGSSSIAANGYSRLPNGLLMQWGSQSASVNTTTTATATFTATFATLYSVAISSNSSTLSVAGPSASNTTTFTWRNISAAAAAASTVNYIAIGI